MWFWLSVAALVCWSGSDLFSKLGCRDSDDKVSHLKMCTSVGTVMGIHAFIEILCGVEISFDILLKYLPVSLLYMFSMLIGYAALRYIELSISSPICNSSGALVAILYIIIGGIKNFQILQLVAVGLVSAGVILLGFTEQREDEELRRKRQDASNYHYSKSALAIALPIIYCVFDAAGTYFDSVILETLDENSANVAYELTFFAAGIICFIYVKFIKKQSFIFKRESYKFTGAIFETGGQLAYIYALADTKHVVFSAPIISSYCILSVIWSRLFLKEKLSPKHYLSILITVIGIAVLGFYDI